jgi:transcriptional regulator with XRE-family HTH domain
MLAIRECRKAAKVSQYELARRSGISRMRLSLAECGYVELDPDEDRTLRAAIRSAVREQVATFRAQLVGQLAAEAERLGTVSSRLASCPGEDRQ